MGKNTSAVAGIFRELYEELVRMGAVDSESSLHSLAVSNSFMDSANTSIETTDVSLFLDEVRYALKNLATRNKRQETRTEALQRQLDARNRQVSTLKVLLKEARDRSVRVDTREIDPVNHNTVLSMDAFFEGSLDTDRYNQFARAFLDFLRKDGIEVQGREIFDIGTGPGLVLKEIVELVAPSSFGGMDFSSTAVEHAKKVLPAGSFWVADIFADLTLPQADVYFCSEVLEHLTKPATAARAILNSAARDSTLVFTVPEGRVDCSRFHINFWSPESWSSFIEDIVGPSTEWRTGFFKTYENSAQGHNVAIIHKL